ncbi:MAG: FAD-dependent oxidoreductase [Pirellulaceae bacterium]|nr:FAD-dependent oxidoreductase [Pirellulaceae bacterium]
MSAVNPLDVIVIGAGAAGLSCAVTLARAGKSLVVLEATDRVGGRIRTDCVDGYTLDHGFQVLLTAYPACRELLDYDALRLRVFDPGALVRMNGKFSVLGDPWRRPAQAIGTVLSPVGTLADKLRIAKVRRDSKRGSLDDLYSRVDQPTIERLEKDGFSQGMIDRFFRPFLGGVFLDESLQTSSRMLEFVFRMFAAGDIAVPADGMAAIARQLAEALPNGTLRLQSTVTSLQPPDQSQSHHTVTLSNGETLSAQYVVMATESSAAARLLGRQDVDTQWSSATTIYYSADSVSDTRKLLMLRGDESGPVQTAVVLSNIAKEYAPADKSLISVSVADERQNDETAELDQAIRVQLRGWFGEAVDTWQRRHVYRIPYGLPKTDLQTVIKPVDGPAIGAAEGIYLCGDHRETPSIHGAMNSGLRAARAILSQQQ